MAAPKKPAHHAVDPLDTLIRHVREAAAAATEDLGVRISSEIAGGGAISCYNNIRRTLPAMARDLERIRRLLAGG